jgi:uncharacterized beta-barrel protein YwiB (DUF1934 family)
VIFIRIKIKGYLKNITDNEVIEFEEKGIKNKYKIIYTNDNVKTTIKIDGNKVMLIRDGSDFINTFVYDKKSSSCNYFLKENNYDVDIDINTLNIDINDDSIYIKYLIIDSNIEYEYKIEMSDV